MTTVKLQFFPELQLVYSVFSFLICSRQNESRTPQKAERQLHPTFDVVLYGLLFSDWMFVEMLKYRYYFYEI